MIRIVQKCDICNKNSNNLQTIILHKKTFDYCPLCENKAREIKEQFKKEMQQEYLLFESRLKKLENNFFYDKIIKHE